MDDQLQTTEKKASHSVYHREFKILGIFAALSGVFIIFSLFSLQTLIGITIFLSSVAGLSYLKWKSLRQKGMNILMQGWLI